MSRNAGDANMCHIGIAKGLLDMPGVMECQDVNYVS